MIIKPKLLMVKLTMLNQKIAKQHQPMLKVVPLSANPLLKSKQLIKHPPLKRNQPPLLKRNQLLQLKMKRLMKTLKPMSPLLI
jgi:hypothetical protein